MEQKQIWNKYGFRQTGHLDSFMGSSAGEDLGGGKDLGDDPQEQEEEEDNELSHITRWHTIILLSFIYNSLCKMKYLTLDTHIYLNIYLY